MSLSSLLLLESSILQWYPIRVEAELGQLVKYPGFIRILHRPFVLIMVFGPDQSNELSMLGDDGHVSSFPKYLEELTTIR